MYFFLNAPSLQRGGRSSRTVEMDVLPFGVPAMPHPRLLWLAAARSALAIHILREADVGNAGGLFSNQVHVRVEDGGVDGLTVLGEHCDRNTTHFRSGITNNRIKVKSIKLTVLKVKSVEVHPFHQVSQGLGFKAGESRVADFTGIPLKPLFEGHIFSYLNTKLQF